MSDHPIDELLDQLQDPDNQAILGLARYDGLPVILEYADKALKQASVRFSEESKALPLELLKNVTHVPVKTHSKDVLVHGVLRIKQETFQEVNGKEPPDTRFESQRGLIHAWSTTSDWLSLCKTHKVYFQVEYIEFRQTQPYCGWQALCDLPLTFKRPEIIALYYPDHVDLDAVYALQRDWKMEMGRHNKGKQEACAIGYRINPMHANSAEVLLPFNRWS